MPIPVLIAFSWNGRAREWGEEILSRVTDIVKSLDVQLDIEVMVEKNYLYVATSSFKPLDYDLKISGEALEWGLKGVIPALKLNIAGDSVAIRVPETPYYSYCLYTWRGRGVVVASPWWLIPALAAVLEEGLIVDELYVQGVLSYGYSVNDKGLHASVRRIPLGSTALIGPTGYSLELDVDYSSVYSGDPAELANLLVEGAKSFLEMMSQKGLREVWVALSGGLDSRTVLAALLRASHNMDVSVKAFTKLMPGTDPKEVEVAKEVARELGVEHRVIDIRRPRADESLKRMIIPPLRGSIVEANGTGGDKTLAPLGHIRWSPPGSVEEMAAKLIKSYDYSVDVPPIRDFTRSLSLKAIEKLRGEARSPLELYRKYLVEYRMMNWLTSFGPPLISPFLYPRYFHKAFRIDPRERDYFILYAKVLDKLDSRLLRVQYYNLGCKLTPIAPLQKIKAITFFALKALSKKMRGQRGSLVPAKQAWDEVESIYKTIESRLPPVNDKVYKVLEEGVKWSLASRPRSARALVVTQNALKLMARISALSMAYSN
jgi:hypothetical protein